MSVPQKHNLTTEQKRMLSDYHCRQHTAAQTVDPSNGVIDSADSFYRALDGQDEKKFKALLMLKLRSWLTEVSSFDPVSGHALDTGIDDLMNAVAKSVQDESPESEVKDRIYRIVSHTKKAVLAIMDHTREKIIREHAMLPIHAVREVDSNSVQWLSRQPGRTLREKLSGKPYMKAVRRRYSVDTAENRLLKAFLLRLEQILIERQNALSAGTEKTCEELLVPIQRWLRTEESAEIGAWGNFPPNNTLLQDKRYRKVWDGWLWLQAIDEQISGDSKRHHQDILSVIYWNTLSLLNLSGRFRTVQQPVGLDYDKFSISPELPVRGYLFPASDSGIKGKIKFIKFDKTFGFITSDDGRELYFDSYKLSRKLSIDSLSEGDEVFFVVGSNRQGECADNIGLMAEAIILDFSLAENKWNLQVDGDMYSLQIISGNLEIDQPPGKKIKLKIEPETLIDIPKTILSVVTGSTFQCPELINSQSGPKRWDSSVVDLCSVRPTFTDYTGSQAHLPFRLLQQRWPSDISGRLVIDCSYARSIDLRSDIETVSMRSLFSHNSSLQDASKSSASMYFAKKLRDYITADRLSYLVPDWANDFDLEGIRKSVNFYFENSTPVPKSITAIFAWQSSKKFEKDRVQKNDFVLVVDSFDGGISITPVQAVYQEELIEKLPVTHGVCWERHPTVIIKENRIHSALVRNLKRNGCQTSEELLHLFGFDGLASDSGEVSFVKDDHWYHLPGSVREVLAQDLNLNILSNGSINDCLFSTNGYRQGSGVFILPLDDTIRKSVLNEDYKWLGSEWSPVEGCQFLNRWQEEVDGISLWRDHLPELSIRIPCDGHDERFYLVRDRTVIPQRGKTVSLPVKMAFILPAKKQHYRFPLQQGKDNTELHFEAYLKSPAFPLKKDTSCKLKMTYTYGADDPYELKFIPLDSAEAGFKSIRVEWRSTSLENLPVPRFPARKSWLDFQNFPKENGKGFSDLLDWCCNTLAGLDYLISLDFRQEFKTILKRRKVGEFIKPSRDHNEKFCCYVNVEGNTVFCRNSELIEAVDENTLYEGCPVYLNVSSGKEMPIGKYISFSEKFSSRHWEKVQDDIVGLKRFRGLRFPVVTIWNHDHSLSEPDVPDHFRDKIRESIEKINSIIETESMPDTLKRELFRFLCCLHKDAPEVVGIRLLEYVKDHSCLGEYRNNIAYAIGNADLPFQQKLLKHIIDPIDNGPETKSITMEILSIALWRSRELIKKITADQLGVLANNLYACLEVDLQKIKNLPKSKIHPQSLGHARVRKEVPVWEIETLCRHLELLLSLLRSREIEGDEFKVIFARHSDLTNKFVTLVNSVLNRKIELKSRIDLQIKKTENFYNTSDLLYALRIYLTGDSGANTIVIKGTRDENW